MANCIMTRHGEMLQYSFEYQTYESNQELWFEYEDYGLVSDDGSCSVIYIGEERQKIVVPNSGNYTAKIYSPSTEIKGGYGALGTYWVNWHKYINGTLIIGDWVESIPEYFMYECDRLSKITFPTNTKVLNNIGDFAFYKSGVAGANRRLDIKNISDIGVGAFSWCRNIREFRVDSSNIKYEVDDNGCLIDRGYFIGDGFYVSKSIHMYPAGNTSQTFETEYNSINPFAFSGAYNLKTITFKNGVNLPLGYGYDYPYIQPFEGCDNLENVYIENATLYTSYYGVVMNGSSLIFFPPKNNELDSIGAAFNGLSSIHTGAIPYNNSLKSIYLQQNFNNTGNYWENPFKDCEILEGFIIGSMNYEDITPFWIKDKRLRAYARNSGKNEETVYLNDVTIIEIDAFYGTRLTTLNIENGIEIQDGAIPDYVNIVRF